LSALPSRRTFFLAFLLLVGCKPAGCVAGAFGDLVGETGDAHCDRRYVDQGRQAASFCQEIIDTVATGQFKDDCRQNHAAAAGDGKCGRDHVIAGCKIDKKNDDNSEVYDWYYDVSDILHAEGPEAGPDGGPTFEDPPLTVEIIKTMCADRSRYEDGAEFREP
jgi:hypothetical protein